MKSSKNTTVYISSFFRPSNHQKNRNRSSKTNTENKLVSENQNRIENRKVVTRIKGKKNKFEDEISLTKKSNDVIIKHAIFPHDDFEAFASKSYSELSQSIESEFHLNTAETKLLREMHRNTEEIKSSFRKLPNYEKATSVCKSAAVKSSKFSTPRKSHLDQYENRMFSSSLTENGLNCKLFYDQNVKRIFPHDDFEAFASKFYKEVSKTTSESIESEFSYHHKTSSAEEIAEIQESLFFRKKNSTVSVLNSPMRKLPNLQKGASVCKSGLAKPSKFFTRRKSHLDHNENRFFSPRHRRSSSLTENGFNCKQVFEDNDDVFLSNASQMPTFREKKTHSPRLEEIFPQTHICCEKKIQPQKCNSVQTPVFHKKKTYSPKLEETYPQIPIFCKKKTQSPKCHSVHTRGFHKKKTHSPKCHSVQTRVFHNKKLYSSKLGEISLQSPIFRKKKYFPKLDETRNEDTKIVVKYEDLIFARRNEGNIVNVVNKNIIVRNSPEENEDKYFTVQGVDRKNNQIKSVVKNEDNSPTSNEFIVINQDRYLVTRSEDNNTQVMNEWKNMNNKSALKIEDIAYVVENKNKFIINSTVENANNKSALESEDNACVVEDKHDFIMTTEDQNADSSFMEDIKRKLLKNQGDESFEAGKINDSFLMEQHGDDVKNYNDNFVVRNKDETLTLGNENNKSLFEKNGYNNFQLKIGDTNFGLTFEDKYYIAKNRDDNFELKFEDSSTVLRNRDNNFELFNENNNFQLKIEALPIGDENFDLIEDKNYFAKNRENNFEPKIEDLSTVLRNRVNNFGLTNEDNKVTVKHELNIEDSSTVFNRDINLINKGMSIEEKPTVLKNEDSTFTAKNEDNERWEPPGSRKPLWTPPKSPHNLVEESLFDNPWGLLAATIFLNKTKCEEAYPYIREFLRDYNTPGDVLKVEPSRLERYFVNIGLVKRSVQIWRMSHDFLYKKWKHVGELHGIGKYGRDAFEMFCLGNMDVEPNDRFLRIYKAWFKMFSDKR